MGASADGLEGSGYGGSKKGVIRRNNSLWVLERQLRNEQRTRKTDAERKAH